jgi:hypothetical protein
MTNVLSDDLEPYYDFFKPFIIFLKSLFTFLVAAFSHYYTLKLVSLLELATCAGKHIPVMAPMTTKSGRA